MIALSPASCTTRTYHATAMPSPPPWYHPVTIDLLVHVLRKSILHPFIACLVPVSLRAIAHPADSPLYIASCVWAALVIACHLLQKLNLRVAYGAPREVDWDHEVVVITGGGSGLGRVLAETWGMRGASVAVLDVREPTDQLAGCTFYQCDVGDAQAVEGVAARIMEDVCTYLSRSRILHHMVLSEAKRSRRIARSIQV